MPAKKDPGPSVKDPELYEELRDDGASKEKAARIANAAANSSRSAVGRRAARVATTRTGPSQTCVVEPARSGSRAAPR